MATTKSRTWIVFYVGYAESGVSDPRTRPVTFLYNGGRASASMWLHMGSIGPVRVATARPEATGAAPYQVSPNQYSLLDKTDLNVRGSRGGPGIRGRSGRPPLRISPGPTRTYRGGVSGRGWAAAGCHCRFRADDRAQSS